MQVIQRMLRAAASRDAFWAIAEPTLVRAAESLRFYRSSIEARRKVEALVLDAIDSICPDLRVRNGPFKGMKYPRKESCGSALFPKLLGSYERELHPIIGAIKDYRYIVDVGCAEGYYLVGLGMQNRNAVLTGYDTNKRARNLCLEMASLNGVDQRLSLHEWCDGTFDFAYRGALIVCDVEGYEAELFKHDIDADLLIEIHDGKDASIRSKVESVFRRRNLRFIPAVPDEYKPDYGYPELAGYPKDIQAILLAEERSRSTGWLWIT